MEEKSPFAIVCAHKHTNTHIQQHKTEKVNKKRKFKPVLGKMQNIHEQ